MRFALVACALWLLPARNVEACSGPSGGGSAVLRSGSEVPSPGAVVFSPAGDCNPAVCSYQTPEEVLADVRVENVEGEPIAGRIEALDPEFEGGWIDAVASFDAGIDPLFVWRPEQALPPGDYVLLTDPWEALEYNRFRVGQETVGRPQASVDIAVSRSVVGVDAFCCGVGQCGGSYCTNTREEDAVAVIVSVSWPEGGDEDGGAPDGSDPKQFLIRATFGGETVQCLGCAALDPVHVTTQAAEYSLRVEAVRLADGEVFALTDRMVPHLGGDLTSRARNIEGDIAAIVAEGSPQGGDALESCVAGLDAEQLVLACDALHATEKSAVACGDEIEEQPVDEELPEEMADDEHSPLDAGSPEPGSGGSGSKPGLGRDPRVDSPVQTASAGSRGCALKAPTRSRGGAALGSLFVLAAVLGRQRRRRL